MKKTSWDRRTDRLVYKRGPIGEQCIYQERWNFKRTPLSPFFVKVETYFENSCAVDNSLFKQRDQLFMKYCSVAVICDKSDAHILDSSGTSINVFLVFNHFWDNVVLPLLREWTHRGIICSEGSSVEKAAHSSPRKTREVRLPRGDRMGVGGCN